MPHIRKYCNPTPGGSVIRKPFQRKDHSCAGVFTANALQPKILIYLRAIWEVQAKLGISKTSDRNAEIQRTLTNLC